MQNRTLQAMILNAGLEAELNPNEKPRHHEQLLREVMQLFECSKIEALKLIISNS